jgi:hypothetical protein
MRCELIPVCFYHALSVLSKRTPPTATAHLSHLTHTLICVPLSPDHQHPPTTTNPPDNPRAGNKSEAFVLAGKDIQNKLQTIGALSIEDRAFHKFCGMTAVVVSTLWRLLAAHDMIPAKSFAKHVDAILPLCIPKARRYVLHGWCSGGAINPKTLQEYIWPFIYSVSNLEPDVVSVFTIHMNVQ